MAHRGLHDETVPENSLAAVEAAIEAGYGVEIDFQLSADGRLILIHDETLERTTEGAGAVIDQPMDALRQTPLKGIEETLSNDTDLFALVSGRAPIFVELKAPDTEPQKAAMAAAMTTALRSYGGAVAVMTFDPYLLETLRRALPDTPLGILAGGEEAETPLMKRLARDTLLHLSRTKPDFIGYYAAALPHPAVSLRRGKRPVLTWTVRSQAEADRLAPHVDQIIFEDFRPR
ncbi:MAG: glycerophosphodiester phosphodiesterase family protein [Pseudomonadota bacterium]